MNPFPRWLGELGRRAVTDALGEDAARGAAYDIALVNSYDAGARMGTHRDSDKVSLAPVVSLSLGDTCVFRFGNPVTGPARTRTWNCAAATCSSSADRPGSRTTACRGCTRAPDRRSRG